MKKTHMCKSCMNPAKAGKNVQGKQDKKTGACCMFYNVKNRVQRLTIENMVLEKIPREGELSKTEWQGTD